MVNLSDLVTIISSVTAAGFALTTYFKGVKHDRRQATLDAFNLLQEQSLDQLNKYTVQEIQEISKNYRTDEYKALSTYIARIEHFCVGVNLKIYDRKTVYKLAGNYLDETIYKKISPMIKRKNYNGIDNYENTHKVIEKMRKKRKGRDTK